MPANITLVAARNVPWTPTIELFYSGAALPVAGATVRMQVRLYPGQPGAPLINIDGMSFNDSAVSSGGRVLRLFPIVPVAVLSTLPTGLNQPELGEADRFAYDIVITYADAAVERLAAGYYFVEPGVTVSG